MMRRSDVLRELDKLQDTLSWAAKYLTKLNESNAALHMNGTVFHSPLTTEIVARKDFVDVLKGHLTVVLPDDNTNEPDNEQEPTP